MKTVNINTLIDEFNDACVRYRELAKFLETYREATPDVEVCVSTKAIEDMAKVSYLIGMTPEEISTIRTRIDDNKKVVEAYKMLHYKDPKPIKGKYYNKKGPYKHLVSEVDDD